MTPEELHNINRTEAEFWWYRGMREIARTLLDPEMRPGMRTGLDVGCGTGFNAAELQSRYGIEMHGVDLARLGVEYCRKRGVANTAVASALELPFASESFDFVSSFDVLPVLKGDGDRRAVAECWRVLRPGGLFFVRAAAFEVLRSRHSMYVAEQHRYRGNEILKVLQESGFDTVRHTYLNSILSPVALFKFRVWEPLLRQQPQSGVAVTPPPVLNNLLLGALKLEASMIRAGVRFPFGQSFAAVARKPR